MNEAAGQAAPQRIANADQEAWVQDRILTAIKMALAASRAQQVRADEPAFEYGLKGIAEGAAIEVIRTLGMVPAGINLRVDPPAGKIANLARI